MAANGFLNMFWSVLLNMVARLILELNLYRKVLISFIRSIACKSGDVSVMWKYSDDQNVKVDDRDQFGNLKHVYSKGRLYVGG